VYIYLLSHVYYMLHLPQSPLYMIYIYIYIYMVLVSTFESIYVWRIQEGQGTHGWHETKYYNNNYPTTTTTTTTAAATTTFTSTTITTIIIITINWQNYP
jgi:carbohydrate-binding DOMON domain-containing protein